MSDEPLVPGPLYGLRTWTIVSENGRERLAGLHHGGVWPPGGAWVNARCARPGHLPPVAGCQCGIHAWHPSARSARRVLASRREVAGVLEARGAVEVHEDGFRAERGRPHALVATGNRNVRLVRRLAEAYGATVIETRGPRELAAWCRERGLGMDEAVVADLLGPVWSQQSRRARRARRRNSVLRVTAALLLAAVMVVLGAHFAVDGPGPKTLYGRTGQVHVH